MHNEDMEKNLQNEELETSPLTSNEETDNEALYDDSDFFEEYSKKPGKNKKKKGTSRAFKRGSLSIVVICIFIAAVILFNVVMNIVVLKYPVLSADVTNKQTYGLSQNTKDFADSLNNKSSVKNITINVLATKDDFENQFASLDSSYGVSYAVQTEKLLQDFHNECGKITVSYINLAKNPMFANKYTDVDWTNTKYVLFIVADNQTDNKKMQNQHLGLSISDLFNVSTDSSSDTDSSSSNTYITSSKVESAVTTAILNVTSAKKVNMTFLKGSGEQDYSSLSSLMTNNGYSVTETTLLTQDLVNTTKDSKGNLTTANDPTIAVLFGPNVDLTSEEVSKLSNWLYNNGSYGRSLIYVAYPDKTSLPNLNTFLKTWSIQISAAYAYETDSSQLIQSSNYFTSVVNMVGDTYSKSLKNPSLPFVTTFARPITILDTSKVTALLQMSDKSGTMPETANSSFNYSNNITGKVTVAAISSKSSGNNKSNLVTFGSTADFSDATLKTSQCNNSAYFVNMMNILSDKQDNSIVIEQKTVTSDLPVNPTVAIVLAIILAGVLPFGILIAGIVIWAKRRHQ
ncbi:MAG: Gldg family protein [Bacillota bacterium]|nr:Gldg family protein [Bacillota bacterium]